jgi:hypothetical protein
LTEDGMTIEVWKARNDHMLPENDDDDTGVLIQIPFGQVLLLRADVIHAGGFCTAKSGNPRCHLYVYKTPNGAMHSLSLKNCYDFEKDGSKTRLIDCYKHTNTKTA